MRSERSELLLRWRSPRPVGAAPVANSQGPRAGSELAAEAAPAGHPAHRPFRSAHHLRAARRRRYTAVMNTTRLSLLTIAAALALAGCGNKGPLVLPEAPDE